MLGVGFDNLTREQTVNACMKLIEKHASSYMVTPNPEIVMASWDNEALKTAAENADLVISDGGTPSENRALRRLSPR